MPRISEVEQHADVPEEEQQAATEELLQEHPQLPSEIWSHVIPYVMVSQGRDGLCRSVRHLLQLRGISTVWRDVPLAPTIRMAVATASPAQRLQFVKALLGGAIIAIPFYLQGEQLCEHALTPSMLHACAMKQRGTRAHRTETSTQSIHRVGAHVKGCHDMGSSRQGVPRASRR